MKPDWASIWEWLKTNRTKVFIVLGTLALVLFIVTAMSKCNSWREDRITKKIQTNINTAVDQISNLKTDVAGDKIEKAEKLGEIKAETELLKTQVFGHEEAKAEADKAVADYEKALVTNSNVNRSAEDLKKAIEKLEATQK